MPYIHREQMTTMKFIPTEMDQDIRALITDQVDYVKYDQMFDTDYLKGLLDEMLWIEE